MGAVALMSRSPGAVSVIFPATAAGIDIPNCRPPAGYLSSGSSVSIAEAVTETLCAALPVTIRTNLPRS